MKDLSEDQIESRLLAEREKKGIIETRKFVLQSYMGLKYIVKSVKLSEIDDYVFNGTIPPSLQE